MASITLEAAPSAALAVPVRPEQKQLAVQAERYALADYALGVCGLVRPGCESAPDQQASVFDIDKDTIIKMKAVVNTRGVKKRLEDEFALKLGEGENVPEREKDEEFLSRTILQLRSADVNNVIKLFDRVEKNNRKAVSNDKAFKAKQVVFRKKVAADDALEKAEDNDYGTFHCGSSESYAEFEDWCQQFEYRDGEKDFVCSAGNDVTRGEKLKLNDEKFAGYELVKIQEALNFFECNCPRESPGVDADAVKAKPVKSTRPDANVIKVELAKWSPAFVVSSYRRLSLMKHPDKEGGSPEAFQELTEYAKVLTEACAKFHGITVKKGLSGKKKNAAAPFANGASKVAICAEFPAHLKTAMSFFGFTEESFRLGSPAEIKKARQALSAEKDRRDKQIQRENLENLLELLRNFPEQQDGECGDLASRSQKQLKTMCMDLCKAHYGSIYGHVQKLK